MLLDGITLLEGSDITNLSIAKGTQAQRLALANVNEGEMFFQTDASQGFYAFTNGSWTLLGTAGSLSSHTSDATIHRTINDAGVSNIDLFSASKVIAELGTKAASSHTHVPADVPGVSTIGTNVIINSNMNLSQRGTSFTGISNAATYTLDRWKILAIGDGTLNVTQSTDVPNKQSGSSLKVDVNVIDATIAIGQVYSISQFVEGFNIHSFGFGGTAAKSVTVSFYVKSSLTGIYTISLRNNTGLRSYPVEYTINAANTWEKKTITVVPETTGIWLLDTGVGLILDFSLAVGSDLHGANATWNTSNVISTANQVNFMATGTNAFLLSQVQVETGTTATDFEHVDVASELEKAQRYYAKTFNQGVTPVQNSGSVLGALMSNPPYAANKKLTAIWEFPSEMRIAPTITTFSPNAVSANWETVSAVTPLVAISNIGTRQSVVRGSAPTAQDILYSIHATADAEL